MITIPVELKGYHRRSSDRSVSFKCDSLIEMESKDIAEIDGHIGDVALLTITDQHTLEDIKTDEILENLPENDLYDNHKTPSQRLRNVLYVMYEKKLGRKPTNEEFAVEYKNKMEAIISRLKQSLD